MSPDGEAVVQREEESHSVLKAVNMIVFQKKKKNPSRKIQTNSTGAGDVEMRRKSLSVGL